MVTAPVKTSAPSVRFLNETPLFKIPLPSCSSHAGLLSHLSLRRRRRAEPAGLVENGNSGPRRPGKWRSEHGVSLLPSLGSGQGCRIFTPSVVHHMLAVQVVLLVGCPLLIKFVLTHVEKIFQC